MQSRGKEEIGRKDNTYSNLADGFFDDELEECLAERRNVCTTDCKNDLL